MVNYVPRYFLLLQMHNKYKDLQQDDEDEGKAFVYKVSYGQGHGMHYGLTSFPRNKILDLCKLKAL